MSSEVSEKQGGAQARGAIKEILCNIHAILHEELGATDASIYDDYQKGIPIYQIAQLNALHVNKVRLRLQEIDNWLSERLARHRMSVLVQLPCLPVEVGQIEDLMIRIGTLRLDALRKSQKSEAVSGKSESSIESLKLSTRSVNVLQTLKVNSIQELCSLKRETILRARNSGQKTLADVETALNELGLRLSDQR